MFDSPARNFKDYGVWLILKIFLKVSIFSFNTRELSCVVLARSCNLRRPFSVKRQNLVENGILKSRRKGQPEDRVRGSLYKMVEKMTKERISSIGDWTFLKDGLTGEELKASEALSMAKR